ncbi:alpha/beta hydrolase [Mycoplasma tauri]|uniref:alpha/beta hydrolase n=1 Tax=Mycoplasma tauri TaxID=547987 RepID=UPI001CBD4443|nr:alpha/beta hydrolase [Mycoplasma tauri]MBZ4203590.1 alpha/beta hydrolase [Mycoplasma tauri]MBZ4226723.1 alpha/beta hydrolase [Mycoplasma tauri]
MSKKINIFNETIHYFEEENTDNKPIVLFVHGFGDKSRTILPIKAIKKRNYVICALDMPGCGFSTSNHRPLTLEYYASVLREFILKVFHNKKINLLSHSLGSFACLKNLNMENVNNYIMLTPFNYNTGQLENGDLNINLLLPKNESQAKKSFLSLFYKPNKSILKSIDKVIESHMLKSKDNIEKFSYMIENQILNKKYLEDVVKPLYLNAVKPFHLVFTKEDKFVTEWEMKILLKDMPNIPYSIIKECGHAVFAQKPEEINEIIINIISNEINKE